MLKSTESERRQAIGRTFRHESQMLLRWLTGRLGDPDEAQDVLQNVYLKVLAFSDENEIENPQGLIFRTATTLAIDELRRRSRFNSRHVAHDPASEKEVILNVESPTPTCEEALQTREAIEAAIAILNALPTNVRASFFLSRLEGKTYNQIAALLGVSVSSVEKYIFRAVNSLKSLRVSPEADRSTVLERLAAIRRGEAPV